MLLEEFLKELYSCGEFSVTKNGLIRENRSNLCPIVAVVNKVCPEKLLDPYEDGIPVSLNEANCIAFELGEKALNLPYKDVTNIIGAADGMFARSALTTYNIDEEKLLRERMLEILKLEETLLL